MEETIMKKSIIAVFALTCILGAVIDASARNGQPNGRQHNCSVFQIFDSTPRTITGTVLSYGAGGGMVVDNGTAEITVYGLGPVWYWASQGIDSPGIGDTVSIDARDIEYTTGIKTIAVSVMIDNQTIQLRDTETGCPLWQGGRSKR
jgi:hypothetical protein